MDAKTRSFADVRAAMQRYVDQDILAGVSWAVLRGRDIVDQQCVGFADREAGTALRPTTSSELSPTPSSSSAVQS